MVVEVGEEVVSEEGEEEEDHHHLSSVNHHPVVDLADHHHLTTYRHTSKDLAVDLDQVALVGTVHPLRRFHLHEWIWGWFPPDKIYQGVRMQWIR